MLQGFQVKIVNFLSFFCLSIPGRLEYKESNTKYRSLSWGPRSHGRILIYQTWPIATDFAVNNPAKTSFKTTKLSCMVSRTKIDVTNRNIPEYTIRVLSFSFQNLTGKTFLRSSVGVKFYCNQQAARSGETPHNSGRMCEMTRNSKFKWSAEGFKSSFWVVSVEFEIQDNFSWLR